MIKNIEPYIPAIYNYLKKWKNLSIKIRKKDTDDQGLYRRLKVYLKLIDQKGIYLRMIFLKYFSKGVSNNFEPVWMHKTFDKRKDKRFKKYLNQ